MKNDLISRQAAIDLAHKNYDTILDFKSDGRTVAGSFEDIINTLPSIQPEPCGDMISREYLKEHIEACWINGRPKYSPELHEVLSWIDDVPSAQPKSEERTAKSAQNVPNNDLISRKAAIDKFNREIIKRRLLDEIYDGALDEFQTEEILRKLPSAQTEPQWIPCSDPSDLPKDKRLWITREISDGFFTLREVSDVIWDMTEWSYDVSGVVAYMPYWEPEPYTERREDD